MKILLDCPFCGAKEENLDKEKNRGVYTYQDSPGVDFKPWTHVVCLECGGAATTIEAWNTRAKIDY